MPRGMVFLSLLIACGGTAVIDGAGGNGSGGDGSGGTAGSGNNPTGTSGCFAHTDCPGGSVCIFASGTCAQACNAGSCDACTQGTFCDDCATSSCPNCLDCTAACVPIVQGSCDDNDPCTNMNEVCVFGANQCFPSCNQGFPCPFGSTCQSCQTGSCCGCDDCVDICI